MRLAKPIVVFSAILIVAFAGLAIFANVVSTPGSGTTSNSDSTDTDVFTERVWERSTEYAVTTSYTLEQRELIANSLTATMQGEVAWLNTCVLPDGAIAFRPSKEGVNTVNQYFSIYTALALLAADSDDAALSTVRAHLEWSFAHMSASTPDAEGLYYTVGNYEETLSGGVVVAEEAKAYDAADSSLALFLTEVWRYVEVSGDTAILDEHKDEIEGSMETLLGLFEEDGLAHGKPSYWVAYLMDNCEVYLGVQDAVAMFQEHYLVGEPTQRDQDLSGAMEQTLQAMDAAFEDVLWSQGQQCYLTYAGQDTLDWDKFYSDATSQLFPAIFGVIPADSTRAVELYDTFCEHYDWTTMDYYTSGENDFYWSVLALGAAKVGDLERLQSFITIYEAFTAGGHAYPAYNGDAAMLVLACVESIDQCDV